MEKVQALRDQLVSVNKKMKEVMKLEPTEFNKVAAIQIFEITFEISWKYMRALMVYSGMDVPNSPRGVIKYSRKAGIIEEVMNWLKMQEARNLTAHTYNEETADVVYKDIGQISGLVDGLLDRGQKFTEEN